MFLGQEVVQLGTNDLKPLSTPEIGNNPSLHENCLHNYGKYSGSKLKQEVSRY